MNLIDKLSSVAVAAPGQNLPGRTGLPTDFLKATLDAQDRVPEKVRAMEPGYVHVSSMVGFCGRQLALLRREERPLFRSVTGGHRVMWRIGRAVESHIREQFINSRNRSGILGNWTCACGGSVRRGAFSPVARCEVCNQPLNVYGEFTLADRDAKIVGNPDLLFEWQKSVVVVEIKSMNPEQWEKLTAPLGDHIFQAGMYHDLLKANGFTPNKDVVFIYCTKQFKYGSPYKEFHVDVSVPSLTAQRQAIREQVKETMQHIEAGTLPPRTLCASHTSSMAKTCPMVAQCFTLR